MLMMKHKASRTLSLSLAMVLAVQVLATVMCFMPQQAMAHESAMPHCHDMAEPAPMQPGSQDNAPVNVPADMKMDGMSLQPDASGTNQQPDHQACVHCDAPDAYVASVVAVDMDTAKVLLAVIRAPAVVAAGSTFSPARHADATAPPASSLPVYLTTQRFRI